MPRLSFFLALALAAAAHQAKPQPSLRAAAVQGDSKGGEKVVFVPVPVEVLVPVPVFIVEDLDKPVKEGGVSHECQKEMMAKMKDKKVMAKAQACEQKQNAAKAAIAKLQDGDAKGAESAVEVTFSKCGGLSETCAKQIAPSVVMKLRLSGMAVEQKCMKVAKEEVKTTKYDDKWKACQKSTIKGMVDSLQQQDMNGAMLAAQGGLSKCHGVEHPCDFQLAPMLVMQLIQSTADAQMESEPEPAPELPPIPIFMAGADVRGAMAPEAPPREGPSGSAISLLNVATRLRLRSETRALRL